MSLFVKKDKTCIQNKRFAKNDTPLDNYVLLRKHKPKRSAIKLKEGLQFSYHEAFQAFKHAF